MDKPSSEILMLIEALKEELGKLRRMPAAVLLKKFMERLEGINCDDEIYEKFLEKLSYRKTIDELVQYCSDFEKYGSKLKVRREHDYVGVVLTTAHSSKGLEWPVCYNSITNYYDEKTARRLSSIEEKRRLLFVSATRARDELYITGQYVAYGPKNNRTYNHFLKECYDVIGQEFVPEEPVKINPEEEGRDSKVMPKSA